MCLICLPVEGPNLFPWSLSLSLSLPRRTSSRLSSYRISALSQSAVRVAFWLNLFFIFNLFLLLPFSSSRCRLSPYRPFRLLHLTSSQSCRHSSYTSNVTPGFSNCKVHPVSFPVSEIRSAVFLLFLSLSLFSVSSLSLPILQIYVAQRAILYICSTDRH